MDVPLSFLSLYQLLLCSSRSRDGGYVDEKLFARAAVLALVDIVSRGTSTGPEGSIGGVDSQGTLWGKGSDLYPAFGGGGQCPGKVPGLSRTRGLVSTARQSFPQVGCV